MANSWGFDGTGYYPPHLSAWGKVVMGYVIPTDITESGEYTILPQQTNPQVHTAFGIAS
jgi:hypothetical protein